MASTPKNALSQVLVFTFVLGAMVSLSVSCPTRCDKEIVWTLYVRQTFTGNNRNQEVSVHQVNSTDDTRFGAIVTNNWAVLDAPLPTANIVARARGTHTKAGPAVGDWFTSLSIVFEGARFNGSTFQVMGITDVSGHWAIVGGTGEFAIAHGIIKHTITNDPTENGNFRRLDIHAFYSPLDCTVGHTICSSCHDKLLDKCHFLSLPTVYNRCHIVEHVVEAIKVACSNDNHGWTARMTNYQREDHEKGCPHAPCYCPLIDCGFSGPMATDCGFSGPTVTLLHHFSSEHEWHSTKVSYKKAFTIRVQVGSAVLMGEDGHMFVINMVMEPLVGVISICCAQPRITGSKFKCRLKLSRTEPSYSQATEFLVRSSNMHGGLPKDIVPFIVLKLPLLSDTGASATSKVGLVLVLTLTRK